MKFLKEYFVFSSSERRGIFAFSIIMFLMILSYIIMPWLLKSPADDFTEFDKEIELLIASNTTKKYSKGEELSFKFNPNVISKDSLLLLGLTSKQAFNIINYRTKFQEFKNKSDFKKLYTISDSLFLKLENLLIFSNGEANSVITNNVKKSNLSMFDLNKITKTELLNIGLTSKQANNIINYREKVGLFKTKEELNKLYTISPDDYKRLEEYIEIIKDTTPIVAEVKPKEYKPQVLSININTASTEEFQKIHGIGVKTSERIIELRNKLGGFYTGEQLFEIYKIDTIVLRNNLSNFRINLHRIKKINLNKVTFKELLKHPYITYNMTKKIINYRDMHGNYKKVEEILNKNLILPKQYRKIVHYLAIE